MFRRVDALESGPEDGAARAARLQRAAVGRGVDSAREAAHHRHAARGEGAREAVRDVATVVTRVARPDNGDERTGVIPWACEEHDAGSAGQGTQTGGTGDII